MYRKLSIVLQYRSAIPRTVVHTTNKDEEEASVLYYIAIVCPLVPVLLG